MEALFLKKYLRERSRRVFDKNLAIVLFGCVLVQTFDTVLAQATISQPNKAGQTVAGKFNYRANVGTVEVNDLTKLILVIDNAALKPGTHLVLVFPEKPQKLAEATVLQKTKPSDMTEQGLSAYKIKIANYFFEMPELAIGVVAPSSRFANRKGVISADLEGDGLKKTFRVAYSSEGAHLTVWNGEPLRGQRKWHGYVHFDYEVEPNGTAKDYANDNYR
jgi:hypothetical protein